MLAWKIIKAKFNPNYTIEVEFKDGLTGTVKIPEAKFRNVFAPLKDIKKFLSGYLHYGAVTWNVDGKILDLAPDTMYEEIKCNNGIYVLGSRHATH